MYDAPVLVTSVGGNVGQGVVKALRAARRRFRIIGVDMEARSAGFSFVDAHYVVPRSDDPAYLERMRAIHEREGFEAVYVCSHAELEAYGELRTRLEEELGATVFANPAEVIEIGRDKLKTAEFLRDNGMPYPRTASADDQAGVEGLIEEYGFPVMLKPRWGASSLNVFVARRREEIEAARVLVPDMIVQQYLPDDRQEYTAGTISDARGRVRACIVLRRDLLQGTTYRTELTEDDDVVRQASKIVEALGAAGPCNVQFRLVDGEVQTFEINPRFSGTSGVRYLYGFNDAELAYDLLHEGIEIEQPRLRPGVVLRYWDEVHVAGASFADFEGSEGLAAPAAKYGALR